jgi:hypothetical protein
MKGDSNEVLTALGHDNTAQKSSFVYDGEPHPVELLRDQRGIYGIGVSDSFDFEAIAWSCGIEPEPHTFERSPRALILRPDRLPDTRPRRAVLQKIAGGGEPSDWRERRGFPRGRGARGGGQRRRWMVTPNPRGRDRESSRCGTTSRPKSDAVTAHVTLQRLRRNTVSAGAVETGMMNRPIANQPDGNPQIAVG